MAKFVIGEQEFDSQEAFVRGGRRCGTPLLNDFQKARVRAYAAAFDAAGGAPPGPIQIPVVFHVIRSGTKGDVPDAQLDQQIAVLNSCYAPHAISFTRADVTRTDNPTWFKMTMRSPAERKAKTALHKDTHKQLNFYTAGIGADLLGWATFPSDLPAEPERDGVVILFSTLPGGASAPYDQGKTAVHEIGHWLGLYHTFEGGCVPPGDEVDDTPYEASPNYGPANPARNTCPGGAKDPTTNYMDYSDDAGLSEFTQGQILRVQQQTALYRPALFVGGPVMDAVGLGIDLETGAF